MIATSVRLTKKLHEKMGYPLGKLHYRVQKVAERWNGFGGPMRHVRRIAFKASHLGEVLARKRNARQFTAGLKPGIATHVDEFKQNGFSYFTDQVDPKLLAELLKFDEEVLNKRRETAQPIPSHPFFFPLAGPDDYSTDHILVRFALQDSIVQAVTAYFGSVPILNGISVTESRSVKIETKKLKASQQWHLDHSAGGDDIASVWVYLTDVNTVDQGPLTYIPISGSRKIKHGNFAGRLEDEEIAASPAAGDVKHILGPRSTVFLVNTQKCYHMGSRLKEGERRIICTFTYAKSGDEKNFIKITEPIPEAKKLLICR